MSEALVGITAVLFGFWLGYVAANNEVSTECERLGGFYVGTKNYKCEPTP